MPLTPEDVRHVALLARLGLEPGDEDFYAQQLSGILAHIDRLQQLDTDTIPPTAQVVEVTNRLREDDPRPGLSQEEALANAPVAADGFFRVPSIQEAGGLDVPFTGPLAQGGHPPSGRRASRSQLPTHPPAKGRGQ